MPGTLFDKIWDLHHVGQRADGRELLYIDRHVVHELHAPHAFAELDAKQRTVRRRDLTLVVQDHTVPTQPGLPLRSAHIDATKLATDRHAVSRVDVDSEEHGIVHVVSPELGIALPGLTLACPDSHASTVGALGCLAFGCGTSELVHVLSTQVMALARPRQMRVNFTGRLAPGVGAKDLALHLIRTVGVDAGRGYAVEYAGEAIRALPIESRMTLCNMTIEWGGRTCLIAPDETTFAWCQGRLNAPKGAEWDEALAWWRTLPTDDGAVFDHEITIDCSRVAPQITWGTDPSQAMGVDEKVPTPAGASGDPQGRTQGALDYMGLPAGGSIVGLPVDRVFIGSCANSQLPDLRSAAAVVRGRHVAPGVQAIVVPGSSTIKRQAEQEGLDAVFRDAGFEWRNAGCSMCAGANGDIGAPGERCVSTTNRNFENRQGRGVRTHLASPEMAAAAALAGHIVDVRDWLRKDEEVDMEPFRSVTGAAAPLPLDDVNTDQIIPSAYLKDLDADMAEGFLAYMRRAPDGSSKRGFVLERPQFAAAPILVTGANFGCGSSREHAVWSMRAFGVRCVIGASPAEFFRENCLKNGVLPVTLAVDAMQALLARVVEVDGREPFTVDLEACEIRGPGGYRQAFTLPAGERTALLEGLDDIGLTMKSLAAIEAWEAKARKLRPFLQAGIRQRAG